MAKKRRKCEPEARRPTGLSDGQRTYRAHGKRIVTHASDDGGIPIYFQAASGNMVDDETHLKTWKLLAELVQRPDFVYVADCKLATTENMNEMARQGGRFITVLPASRKEDRQFRQRLLEEPRTARWRDAYAVFDEDGSLEPGLWRDRSLRGRSDSVQLSAH